MRSIIGAVFSIGVTTLASHNLQAAELKYRVKAIDVLSGDYSTFATGFNDRGEVALTARGQFDFGAGSRAFVYQNGKSEMIPLAGALSSYSGDINN